MERKAPEASPIPVDTIKLLKQESHFRSTISSLGMSIVSTVLDDLDADLPVSFIMTNTKNTRIIITATITTTPNYRSHTLYTAIALI
jgi:hypothetical protein